MTYNFFIVFFTALNRVNFINAILVSSILLINTACVSETLGLSPKTNDENIEKTAYEQKVKEVDDRTEKKIDSLWEKLLAKIGL